MKAKWHLVMSEVPSWIEIWVKGEIRKIVATHQHEMEKAHFGAKNAIDHDALKTKQTANREAIDKLMRLFIEVINVFIYNKEIIPWGGVYYQDLSNEEKGEKGKVGDR
jgi:hypothetical protein